jgi:chaperonin GroES
MRIRPLGKRIVVKRALAQKTKGGILLPEAAQEKPKQGEVIAVGPGEEDSKGRKVPLSVKVGDKIIFSSYAGVEFNPDTENEYLILSEDDVLAIVN